MLSGSECEILISPIMSVVLLYVIERIPECRDLSDFLYKMIKLLHTSGSMPVRCTEDPLSMTFSQEEIVRKSAADNYVDLKNGKTEKGFELSVEDVHKEAMK